MFYCGSIDIPFEVNPIRGLLWQEHGYPPEYKVSCRRRPKRKQCLEEIIGFEDLETDDIIWMCPKCGERGRISNWQGTIWDMRSMAGVH